MGYMRHHAIIVTSFKEDLAAQAHAKAVELGMLVTNIVRDTLNYNSSFLIGPDGSKEGWNESDRGDTQRERMIAWLDTQREDDDSTALDWVEVQYGDENHQTLILHDSDQRARLPR